LAIDFYLPAFPAMAQAFATDEKHVQTTLAAYFLGLSLGQLAYGPVADRFGRRIPLLFGVALFTLASLACAYAPNLDTLILSRFIQALGGCAGMVLSRAIVSDKCDPVASAKVFSQLMLVMGLAPILAPMLGGVLVNLAGWQSIFLTLSLFSAACLVAIGLGLPESLPAHMPRQPLSGALRQYLRLLADRVFVGHALTGGIAIAGMFAYIAGSPFVFIKLYGVPAEHYGWLFGTNAAGFIWWRKSMPACWPSVARRFCWYAQSGCTWRQGWCCWVLQRCARRTCGHCWCRCLSASQASAASYLTLRPAP